MFDLFIAVALALVIVNVFIFFVLKRVVIRTGRQIRARAVWQFSVYDNLIDKKSTELDELTAKQEKLKASLNSNSISEIEIKNRNQTPVSFSETLRYNTKYVDDNFTRNYRKIKENLNANKLAIIRSLVEKVKTQDANTIYDQIRSKMSLDRIYALSELSSENQIQELMNDSSQPEIEVLNEYVRENTDFDIVDYFDYIKSKQYQTSKTIYIRTGDRQENFDGIDNNIITIYDEKICEGFSIEFGNIYYDFSVTEREII